MAQNVSETLRDECSSDNEGNLSYVHIMPVNKYEITSEQAYIQMLKEGQT